MAGPKEFYVKCPDCGIVIVVDARTGTIIRRHAPEKDDDEPPDPALFDEALGKVKKTQKEGESVLDDAFKKYKKRERGLDDLFREAKKKADKKGPEVDPKDRSDFWD